MDGNSFILTLLNLQGWGPARIYKYLKKNSLNYERCVKNLVNEFNEDEKIYFKKELVKSKIKIQNNKNAGIECCNIFDSFFPEKLYNCGQKCLFLFYKGDISLLNKKSITIIGTRNPTAPFIEQGIKATKYFAEKGYVIVSGLALGCDTIAHTECLLSGGKTIAVLPSPCNNIVPYSNNELANNIVKNGGLLISEYSVGEEITKYNYAKRDRIQSLLSSVILVIQASNDSGTMIAVKKHIMDKKFAYAIAGNTLSLVNNFVDATDIEKLNEIENWILQ